MGLLCVVAFEGILLGKLLGGLSTYGVVFENTCLKGLLEELTFRVIA